MSDDDRRAVQLAGMKLAVYWAEIDALRTAGDDLADAFSSAAPACECEDCSASRESALAAWREARATS